MQTRSCGSPTTPCCKLYGLKKVLGVGAISTHVQKQLEYVCIYSGACLNDLYTFNLPMYLWHNFHIEYHMLQVMIFQHHYIATSTYWKYVESTASGPYI